MAANVNKRKAEPSVDPYSDMLIEVPGWARGDPVRYELQIPPVVHTAHPADKADGLFGRCMGTTGGAPDDVIILANDIKKNKDINEKIRQIVDMIEAVSGDFGRVRMDGEGYGR